MMKKIIAAFDGLKYAENTTRFALDIAKQSGAHLVGVFLEDFTYTSYKIYDLVKQNVSERELKAFETRDAATRGNAAVAFENACRNEEVQYSIHHDKNIAFRELLHESIYADLLIINNAETLSHYEERLPTDFIRDILADVQCPVLLVPEKYVPVRKIVFLYDGRPSSVHALKMFSYLLQWAAEYEIEVVSVKGFYDDLHVPDNRLMKEFMKRHFPKAAYTVLKGHSGQEIISHLKRQDDTTLVVMGAYGRGRVSRFFKQSMADVIMNELTLPLFIAHYK